MKTLFKPWQVVLAALFVAACGGGDDSLDDRASVADPKVRFVNAVPLGANLTLYRNDTAQSDATNTDYKFASRYFDVETGPASWPVREQSTNTELDAVPIDADRGNRYSIVALAGSSGVELLLIDDPYNKSITSDNARVRVVNASLNAQNVDVYLTARGVDLATVAPTFAAVGYQTAQPASGGDSVDLEGGDYQLRIAPAGTKGVIFSAPVTLAKNADWLLLTLARSPAPGDVSVLVVQSSDEVAQTAIEITSP